MKLKLLREAFLLRIFLLHKVRKNGNITKELFFETTCGFLTRLFTVKEGMPDIGGFLDYFSFSHYLATFCRFQNETLSSSNAGPSFR